MTVFVDTSALYAVLDAADAKHKTARKVWQEILSGSDDFLTTNYILLETVALVQHRLGAAAVQVLHGDVFPVLEVHWIDEQIHASAVSALLAAGRRRLSLVDCVSFEVMRRRLIDTAFAFDADFRRVGFHCIPV